MLGQLSDAPTATESANSCAFSPLLASTEFESHTHVECAQGVAPTLATPTRTRAPRLRCRMAFLMPFTPASSITRGVPAFRPSFGLTFDAVAAGRAGVPLLWRK